MSQPVEAERYELHTPTVHRFRKTRRELFEMLGGGVLVLLWLEGAQAQESGGRRPRGAGGAAPAEIGAWLHVDEKGQVTVYTGKAEVGQNIRTSLTQAVAEELRAPVETIRLVMADTQLVPFDMGTFGSRTTPDMAQRLRRVAAAAREVLLDLGAERWQVERAAVEVAGGRVRRKGTSDSAGFGELTKGQKLSKTVSAETPVTPAGQWQVAGKPLGKIDGRAFVTGRHHYPSDIQLPEMVHGKVLRPASYGASLASADLKAAEALPGVVIVRDGDFVGATAPTAHEAARAVKAIRAEWREKPQLSSKELYAELTRKGRAARGITGEPLAPPSDGMVRRHAVYHVAYIAHAPLEPRAAVAQWEGDRLTVWTGTQRPFGVRGELAAAFHIPEQQVRVIVPDTGSGYGGKHTGEAALEAARLAKAAGKPVKVAWTREEELTWAYFRPAGVIEVAGALRPDGTLAEWEQHNYNSGGSAVQSPYDVLNQRSEFHAAEAPLRQGSYRALAATANHFARESHMDDLAHAAKLDPLAFRLRNLKEGRLRAVLEAAANAFGWQRKPPAGRGFGLACGTEKGGFVATCVEAGVDRQSGQVRVHRATTAFECGAVVNPDGLKHQIEGAVLMGLGGALFEAIGFENGKITNGRFSAYRVPRFVDVPPILETVLVDRKDLPSAGAGETPIVAIAPAIGNAVFAAAGVRLREMPLKVPHA